VLIAHERHGRDGPDYLPRLKQDLIDVIKKYVSVGAEQVTVQLDSQEGCDVLELNITLPEEEAKPKKKVAASRSTAKPRSRGSASIAQRRAKAALADQRQR